MKKQPAKWIAENPDAYLKGHRSFWLNAFSSPWTPWEKIVTKFLEAQGDPEKLKVVFNTLLGELWEDRGDLEDEDAMLSRREQYDAELPDDVLVLTVGVDTQDNRLEYEVVGHGLYGETWGIKKGIINGRPDTSEVWARLDDVIDHVYRFKNGKGLKVSFTCVDSGGHFTQEVYAECKARQNKRVFAIKGKGGDGIPYTAPPSKVKIVIDGKLIGKCWLYTLGVDAGKSKIMNAIKVQEKGAKYSERIAVMTLFSFLACYLKSCRSSELDAATNGNGRSCRDITATRLSTAATMQWQPSEYWIQISRQ